ncbi:MAG: metallophosphoesterase [Spirochaetales bacterium]|nr:metallophosphoesterase [Spirochaetales bacterium]
MTFDFIGDIHGHAEKLKTLLGKLGYVRKGGVFKHPDCERNAVFLGDFIDRGPEIRETLEIVRAMVESKRALAIMGNHEYNAICFHTERPAEPGIWMRRRTDKNLYQYIETLYQFREYRGELAEYLRWFRTLPLWLDLGDVRAVHAAWHVPSMEKLAGYPDGGRFISDKLLQAAGITGSDEHTALENLLKGIEIDLPDGATLTDKDGNVRSQMRVRWWMEGRERTYS